MGKQTQKAKDTCSVVVASGPIKEIRIGEGLKTVKEVLQRAEIDLKQYETIRVNAKPANLETNVAVGDLIVLADEVDSNK